MFLTRHLIVAGTVLTLAACGGQPSTRELAQEAIEAAGGAEALRDIRTITMRGGDGTRRRLGQAVRAGDEEAPATLRNVVETVDLAGGRAALDYELTNGDFTQHRQEILTKQGDQGVGLENVAGRPLAVTSPTGLFSWGSQNSPEFLLRRNVVTVLLAAAETGSEEPAEDRMLDGQTYKYGTATLPNGEAVGLYFDAEANRLAAFETTDTEVMLGDVQALYTLSDYREVGGVMLPHRVVIDKEGVPYSEVQFATAAINAPEADALFEIPADAADAVGRATGAGEGGYSPVEVTRIADGVHFVRAYSHNSLLVEFPEYLVVVEAPYTDAQSQTLARVLGEQFPDKPIRYAVVTHPHYDHIGGVRGLAAHGATILTEARHESIVRPLVERTHSRPPDTLETRRRAQAEVGGVEVFDGRRTISDGGQTLELYAVEGLPHVDPKVLAYVPTSRVLFQSDIFFPGTGGGATPDAVRLLQAVRDLGLRPQLHVGGHGGVAPFTELEQTVARAARN